MQPPGSHCCAPEGPSEPLRLVLSHAPTMDGFRLCLGLAGPHSAAESVPEWLILCFLRLFSGFSSLAALLAPKCSLGGLPSEMVGSSENKTCVCCTLLCSCCSDLV